MQKKVLIAVDGSHHARNAMLYAAGLFSTAIDLDLTLVHIQPIVSQFFLDEARTNPKIEQVLKRVVEENTIKSMEMLQKNKELLVREGMTGSAIQTVSLTRRFGTSRDIIEYAHKHEFDLVVVGRRGLSRLQKVFMGNNSSELVEHSGDVPVCIVDGEVRPHKVLVAVDIHRYPSRMLRLVGKMFAGLPKVQLTFYYVMHDLKLNEVAPFIPGIGEIEQAAGVREQEMVSKFWQEARQQLGSAGLREGQLSLKSPRRITKAARMIIDEAEKNDFDTVIIGRTGSDLAFFFGTVARYVSERITDRAVWVVGG